MSTIVEKYLEFHEEIEEIESKEVVYKWFYKEYVVEYMNKCDPLNKIWRKWIATHRSDAWDDLVKWMDDEFDEIMHMTDVMDDACDWIDDGRGGFRRV